MRFDAVVPNIVAEVGMNHFSSIVALQGTNMVGRSAESESDHRIKDVWLRTQEMRMVEILAVNGFTEKEISAIVSALKPALKSDDQNLRNAIGDRLRMNGISPALADTITRGIASSTAQR